MINITSLVASPADSGAGTQKASSMSIYRSVSHLKACVANGCVCVHYCYVYKCCCVCCVHAMAWMWRSKDNLGIGCQPPSCLRQGLFSVVHPSVHRVAGVRASRRLLRRPAFPAHGTAVSNHATALGFFVSQTCFWKSSLHTYTANSLTHRTISAALLASYLTARD